MPRRLVPFAVSFACLFSISLGLFFAAGLVGQEVFAVPSGNMEKTLPRGSYVAVRDGEMRRGDIIVHRTVIAEGFPANTFIKRVIAKGGDTVACCTDGKVVLNGKELDEPYVFEDDGRPFGPVAVPPGRLFLLGDHRSASSDSRSYLDDEFSGTIAEGDVVGVVSGPYTRGRAHMQPLLTFLPYLLGLALVVGLATEAVLRSRDTTQDGDGHF